MFSSDVQKLSHFFVTSLHPKLNIILSDHVRCVGCVRKIVNKPRIFYPRIKTNFWGPLCTQCNCIRRSGLERGRGSRGRCPCRRHFPLLHRKLADGVLPDMFCILKYLNDLNI